MPAAVVGLALVGAEVITVATLSYVALGVTVAGLVTKNKTLLKIGGQLGLAAGVSALATSFMSSTASAASAAGNAGKVVAGANGMDDKPGGMQGFLKDASNISGLPEGGQPLPDTPEQLKASGWDQAVDYGGRKAGTDTSIGMAPLDSNYKAPELVSPDKFGGQGANLGTRQGNVDIRTPNDNPNIGNVRTANDTNTSTKATPEAGFFDFLNKDSNKYAMMEGGKIIAGGLQGMAATSNANTQLAENRRVADLQRANMASVGRGRYGLMGAR